MQLFTFHNVWDKLQGGLSLTKKVNAIVRVSCCVGQAALRLELDQGSEWALTTAFVAVW